MEKSCGTIIVKDNKVLMIKQTNDVIGFPKGHVEENETELETAIRETKEETNIDVIADETKRYETSYIMQNGKEKTVVFFLAKPTSDNIIKQECEIVNVEWVDKNEVINKLTYPNIKELFKEVLNDI